MRRSNTRLISIIAGFIFLIFILSRLQRWTSSDHKSSGGVEPYSNKPLKFPENKPASCSKDLVSSSKVPVSVSVVISTYFSSESLLEHVVNNVLSYTDSTVLKEVIITSSIQMSAEQTGHLARFTHQNSLIIVREGLNLQNNLSNKLSVGHAYTKGSVVVFIDDTVLVSKGYLEPLLKTLTLHQWGIAMAATNFILPDDFEADALHADHKWIFDWHLGSAEPFQMDFAELTSRSETEIFPSTMLDSSMFAMQKSYITRLDSIRSGLHYVNDADLSFTSWLCADGVYISPCSRIGQAALPTSPSKAARSADNSLVADLYLKSEKYKQVFQSVNKDLLPLTVEERQRSERYATSLSQCSHSFDWYMDKVVDGNVYTPSSDVRAFGRFIVSSGSVFTQSPAMIFLLSTHPVKYAGRDSTIEYLKSGQLRTGSNCLVLSDRGYVVLEICDYQKPIFKWEWTDLKQFKVTVNGEDRCISHATDPYPEQSQRQVLMYTTCAKSLSEKSARFQMWNSFTWL